jgi:hypothetical protein
MAATRNVLMRRVTQADKRPEAHGGTKSLLGAGMGMLFIVSLRFWLAQLLRAGVSS